MNHRLVSFSLLAIFVISGASVSADDAVTFEELLSRLQQTEDRLGELEQQSATPFLHASHAVRPDEPIAIPPAKEDMVGSKKSDSAQSDNGDGKASSDDEGDDNDDEPTLEERLAKLEEGWKDLDDAWTTFDKAEKNPPTLLSGSPHRLRCCR